MEFDIIVRERNIIFFVFICGFDRNMELGCGEIEFSLFRFLERN